MVTGTFSIPLERTGYDVDGSNPSASLPLRQYVAGIENHLLQVVADTFVDSSPAFSRLLLHGPTGTGKSHLLRGLLARWKDAHPHRQVVFCSGRDFARDSCDPTDALATKCPDFLNSSWFILDNIEELVEYPRAQARLCGILDERSRLNRPFVAIGRQHPTELRLLAALSSRLSDGLVVPVQLPRTVTRAALLQHMASHRKLSFDRTAAWRLAKSLSATYPRLLRSLLELEKRAAPMRHITVNDVADYFRSQSCGCCLDSLAQMVADEFGITVHNLRSSSRQRTAVSARGIMIYLARENRVANFSQLGKFLGGRDHSTVSHAWKTMCKRIQSEPTLQRSLTELKTRLSLSPT
ncbi:MAG: hypothetical protein CMJ81_07335 [Planctomycetaceae bacterium]|nr:hypothetical protein [Planctomycetaceae bacterium]MBP62120.1 hypothetical protein [Planctomycetaceae bacterium]